MSPKRHFFVSASSNDLDWITVIMEKMVLGVEIDDFALPMRNDGSRERAFELWHMWRETVPSDVAVMMHAPFIDMVPGSPEPELVEVIRRRHQEVLTLAEGLGARAILFHSGYNPLVRGPGYRDQWLASTAQYFTDLMNAHRGFTFLIENMWEPTAEPLVELIDAINSPQLRLCLDVGHVQVYSKEPVDSWIQKIGVRLGHVHLNDNNGQWDQEGPLGSGIVPLDKIFTTLNGLGYFGTMTLEMRGREAVLKSMEHLLRLGIA